MLILEQYYLGCLSQASYLVGDSETGHGAVIDPRRDVDEYLAEADRLGLRIEHILLTHLHADFLAGHLEMADATGARIHLGAAAQTDYPMTPMREGGTLELGRVRLRFLETPGHTPESTCILAFADPESEEPHAVFTGDTLFIGSVGRPDLLVSVGCTAEELAGQLYDSLHGKLMTLPDQTLVYPGHGAGSACGKGISDETVSTIGAQRSTNLMLQIRTKSDFIAQVTADQPAQPQYFAFNAELNRKARPTLEEILGKLKALTPAEVRRREEAGAVLLDVRDPEAFAKDHLKGSLSIGLDGSFASWAGTLMAPDTEIVLLADPGAEREAATRLGRIGYDNVAGFVSGGYPAATAAFPERTASFPRFNPEDVDAGDAHLLDIRAQGEWDMGHIDDTPNIPLNDLDRRAEEIPRDKTVLLVCRSGYRSVIAASLLERKGFERVADLRGGFLAWEESRAGVQ